MSETAVIYVRLSREDEDKIDGNKSESRSIENQIKTLSDFAGEHDLDIVKIYYDDGYSGAQIKADRIDIGTVTESVKVSISEEGFITKKILNVLQILVARLCPQLFYPFYKKTVVWNYSK